MLGLLVFLFILGILIVVHEFGHFIVAKRVGVRVEQFSLGFGVKIFGRKIKETEYSVNAIPLGGYVKLAGESLEDCKGASDEYMSKSVLQRGLIIFFGPLLNYLLGFLCFWLIFFAGYPTLTAKVGGLVEGLGAKDAGIQVGDKIIAVDERPVVFWEDLQSAVQAKKTKEKVLLSLLRSGREYKIEVRLREKEVRDPLGQKRNVALLGITPFLDEFVKIRHGPWQSLVLSMNKTGELTVMTYKALFMMITGKMSLRQSVTGPLGIYYITSKAASMGLIAVLHLIAILSVSLAIFNLLPLPVLDGGHILFLAIEKIRGKRLSIKAEHIITQAGLTLIILLAVFVTYNDLVRFFGDKIAKFFKL